MLAIALVSPAGIVRAQTGGTSNTVTVSSSTATGIALGTAAQYRVKHGTSWDAYEDIMILATLNGAAKMAANTGHPMTTQDYGTLAAQTKNWLDSRAPDMQTFLSQNQADRLRYGFDTLFSFTGPVATAAFGGFIKSDISELERTMNDPQLAAAVDPWLFE